MSADLVAEVEAARATMASLCVDANALAELAGPTTSNTARGLASGLQTVQATLDHVSEYMAAQPVAAEKPAKAEKPAAKPAAKPKAKAEKKDEPAVKVEEPEPYTPPGASRYGIDNAGRY